MNRCVVIRGRATGGHPYDTESDFEGPYSDHDVILQEVFRV